MTPILDQSWTLGRHWFTSDGMIFQEWLCDEPKTRLRVTNFLPGPRGYDQTFKITGVDECAQVVDNLCEINGWTLIGGTGPRKV